MLLSIIIPVYNAGKFIERCVISIIKQVEELKNIEVVIINDGSTDNSLEILNKLQKLNPIIVLYEQENSGVGFTRNIGLEKAQGDYIWFIDADDYIDGDILKRVYKIMEKENPETILLGYKTVNLNGDKISEHGNNSNSEFARNEIINNSLYTNTVWSKVINRNIINTNKITFDTSVKTAEDFDFSFRVLYFSKKIVTIDNIDYNYVVNPNSISNIRTNNHLERLAKDSVTVALNLETFMNSNEPSHLGSKKIFKQWLDNYLYGLLFSLFRFNYSISFIKEIIQEIKENKLYPINSNKMNFKKELFVLFANNKTFFLLGCRINSLMKRY